MRDGARPPMKTLNTRTLRISIGLAIAAATSLCLAGCGGSGVSDITLAQAAVRTINSVKDAMSKIPDAWVLAKDPERNGYGYCDDVIDTGPNGSAYWAYGTAIDFTHAVSNAELLDRMTPVGTGWKLTSTQPNEQGGSAMNYYFSDGRVELSIMLNGESTTRPRVGIIAHSECVRNGTMGPGTFPTPNPAHIKG